MKFFLPHSLLLQLQAVRDQRGHQDDLERSEDAFLLDPGLGPQVFLTADGRVLIDGREWDGTPVREANDDEATAALVVGARKTGIGDLLGLIPTVPPAAIPCPDCKGRRWIVAGIDVGTGNPGEVVCFSCWGKGWRPQAGGASAPS